MKSKNIMENHGVREPNIKTISQGLAAKDLALQGEKKNDLILLRAQIHADLKPRGELERILADRVVLCLWRLNRALRVEAGYLDNAYDGSSYEDPFGKILSHYNQANKLIMLTRYETSIERSMYRALRELKELQKERAAVLDAEVVE